jgi:hypothetical protein
MAVFFRVAMRFWNVIHGTHPDALRPRGFWPFSRQCNDKHSCGQAILSADHAPIHHLNTLHDHCYGNPGSTPRVIDGQYWSSG